MQFRIDLHAAADQNWVLRFAEQYQIKRHCAIVLVLTWALVLPVLFPMENTSSYPELCLIQRHLIQGYILICPETFHVQA